MINIDSPYVIEGCPIDFNINSKRAKNILIAYGFRLFLIKINSRSSIIAKRKKNKVYFFYWGKYFWKVETKKIIVEIFETKNIDDLNFNISNKINSNHGFKFNFHELEKPKYLKPVKVKKNSLIKSVNLKFTNNHLTSFKALTNLNWVSSLKINVLKLLLKPIDKEFHQFFESERRRNFIK